MKSKKKIRRKSKFDIILVNMPPWNLENPPLGISYLATFLRQEGFKLLVFDFNAHLFNHIQPEYRMLWHIENKNLWKHKKSFKVLLKIIAKELDYLHDLLVSTQSEVIGFSTTDPKEDLIIEVVRRIKKSAPDKKILIGGPGCFTEESREPFTRNIPELIDAFVIGEGEQTLSALLKRLKKGGSLRSLPGVLSRNERNQFDTYKRRSFIKDIDTVPFPRYEEFNLKDYSERSLALIWSRGCIGNCSFCKERVLWGKHRQRKANHIFQEIKYHVVTKGITKFYIWDSALNGNPTELGKVCDRIIRAGYSLEWSGMAIPHRKMQPKFCKKMKKAGCTRLIFGVESGSDRILRLMRKSFTTADAEKALKNTHQAGITTSINIMLGFPGEEEIDFHQTLDFVTRNRQHIDLIDSLSVVQVVDGAPICINAKRYGIILPSDNWCHHWYTASGNDLELRMARGDIFLAKMGTLDLKVQQANTMAQEKDQSISTLKTFKKEMIRVKIA